MTSYTHHGFTWVVVVHIPRHVNVGDVTRVLVQEVLGGVLVLVGLSEWYRDALGRIEYQHRKEMFAHVYGKPVNLKRGMCPWCGERQAQILIINDDDNSYRLVDEDSIVASPRCASASHADVYG